MHCQPTIAPDVINKIKVSDNIENRLRVITELIDKNEGINRKKLVQSTDIAEGTIKRDIQLLTENGIIEFRGNIRAGGFYLIIQE